MLLVHGQWRFSNETNVRVCECVTIAMQWVNLVRSLFVRHTKHQVMLASQNIMHKTEDAHVTSY